MSEVKKWYIGVYSGEAQARACSPAEFEIINEREGRSFVLAEDFDQVTAERDALQKLLNQRDEQVETMRQLTQGEPVAWRYREGEGAQWRLTDMPTSTWYFDPRQYEVHNLYERTAPAAVVLPERKPEPSCMTQIDDDREASIWNACLDELKRLNPSL